MVGAKDAAEGGLSFIVDGDKGVDADLGFAIHRLKPEGDDGIAAGFDLRGICLDNVFADLDFGELDAAGIDEAALEVGDGWPLLLLFEDAGNGFKNLVI